MQRRISLDLPKQSLALTLGFAFILVNSAPAAAQTISASHKIYIRAVVAPARTVVVDKSGQIIEIDSNTASSVTPQVFLNRVTADNEVSLTPAVYNQYLKLLAQSSTKVGQIYKLQGGNLAATSVGLSLAI
jgi:hypothetical protein